MILNDVRCKVARLFLVTAVLAILLGTPAAPNAFAGDCPSVSSGSSC
jgi:hypothetical protein